MAFGFFVHPYNYLVRPIVIIIFLSQVRARFHDILVFLAKSGVIIGAIFGYVVFNAQLFYFLFKGTFQGTAVFPTLGASVNQLLILLTTANFPDVMLPAYDVYYIYAWCFVVYFVVAFYFLLNVLIANVFNMFRNRLEQKARENI